MSQVICKSEIPKVEGLDDNQMTVGRHQILTCDGDWEKTFDFTKAEFKLEETQKYIFKVLKAEARSINSFEVDLTVYHAGTYQIPNLILTDGTNEIDLGSQKFQVKTVIEKTEDGKPPEPFGPMAPLSLHWPAIYLISSLLIVALLATFSVYRIRRRVRFKKLIDGLKQHDSSLDPEMQFYKSMRALEKMGYPISEIEQAFRLYALRVFQLPLFDLNNRQAIRFMKKHRPQYKKQRPQLQKFLDEFEELRKNSNLDAADKNQFVKKLYRFIDAQTVPRATMTEQNP